MEMYKKYYNTWYERNHMINEKFNIYVWHLLFFKISQPLLYEELRFTNTEICEFNLCCLPHSIWANVLLLMYLFYFMNGMRLNPFILWYLGIYGTCMFYMENSLILVSKVWHFQDSCTWETGVFTLCPVVYQSRSWYKSYNL
jgi:hypothetical protein